MSEDACDEIHQRKMSATKEAMFFLACLDNKPIGKAKHFHMLGICQNLMEMSDEIPTQAELWKKLRSLVNLDLLEEKNAEEQDEYDKAHDSCFRGTDDFKLPDDVAKCVSVEAENPKLDIKEEDESSDKPVKPIKDYTRNRAPKAKAKEVENDEEEEVEIKLESPVDSDDDTPLKPPNKSSRRSTLKKTPAKKPVPKRSSRSVKEPIEKDTSPVSTSSKKTDEEAPPAKKTALGKRSLRSRGEDDGSSPTHTPNTRSRRI